MARVMSMYQMWLDDLYPRAKFRDGLALVEKVGHTKRLQVMRKTWMQATKPSRTIEDEEQAEAQMEAEADKEKHNETPTGDGEPDEDELDALFAASTLPPQSRPPADTQDQEDIDELDALMAEEAAKSTSKVYPLQQDNDIQFADEEEAMAAMGDMW